MKQTLTNKILTRLSDAELARLMPLLYPVTLAAGRRLSEAGDKPQYVYFPESAVISCQAQMEDGKSTEIGMVGREGVTGLCSLLGLPHAPYSQNVSVAGSALRVSSDELERETQHSEAIRRAVSLYAGEYLTQISQRSACASLHRLEQRLAVWLLLVADRLDSDVIQITQEQMGQLLGVRRASINCVAPEMQAAGGISYKRAKLHITDRQKLETIACECYRTIAAAGPQPPSAGVSSSVFSRPQKETVRTLNFPLMTSSNVARMEASQMRRGSRE